MLVCIRIIFGCRDLFLRKGNDLIAGNGISRLDILFLNKAADIAGFNIEPSVLFFTEYIDNIALGQHSDFPGQFIHFFVDAMAVCRNGRLLVDRNETEIISYDGKAGHNVLVGDQLRICAVIHQCLIVAAGSLVGIECDSLLFCFRSSVFRLGTCR